MRGYGDATRPAAVSIQNQFWMETAAGRVFVRLRDMAVASTDPSLKTLLVHKASLVPRAIDHALQAARTRS